MKNLQHLFNTKVVIHVGFWLTYYLIFSIVWVREDQGYFASFYLEFVLLPARIMAVYTMLYVLLPQFLLLKKYLLFFIYYALILLLAGLLQRTFSYFFYENLLLEQTNDFINVSLMGRSILLINSTVIFVAAIKIFQLYLIEKQNNNALEEDTIKLKSNRRTHLVMTKGISYIEGMGNYVTYYLEDSKKIVVYTSISSALEQLPSYFIRIHRSYIINKQKINSYSKDNVMISGKEIPRGKDIEDEVLSSNLKICS